MSAVLVDTDVFSFVFKRDTRSAPYTPHIVGVQPCLSFQSVAELRLWELSRQWGPARRQSLANTLTKYVVLPYDDLMCREWAAVIAARQRIGRPIECGDAWIAATALRHKLALLTHNAADYAEIPNLHVISYSG